MYLLDEWGLFCSKGCGTIFYFAVISTIFNKVLMWAYAYKRNTWSYASLWTRKCSSLFKVCGVGDVILCSFICCCVCASTSEWIAEFLHNGLNSVFVPISLTTDFFFFFFAWNAFDLQTKLLLKARVLKCQGGWSGLCNIPPLNATYSANVRIPFHTDDNR